MKLYIIRHGDPNYEKDCLTDLGKREAAALGKFLSGKRIDEALVSPLGRARETAELCLSRPAEVTEWLREFPAKLRYWELPELEEACPCPWTTNFFDRARVVWDVLPAYWTKDPRYFDRHGWRDTVIAAHSDMAEVYDRVIAQFDAFLAAHGYERSGECYRVTQSTDAAVALVCHFGIECVLLAHLLGMSPFLLWHTFMAAPSSVTVVNTEERRKGTAAFRVSSFGDTSHLALAGMEPGFPGRYCERFEDETLH